MDHEEFRRHGHELVDWVADYLGGRVREYPVRAQVKPGEVRGQLPAAPPLQAEPFARVLADFQRVLLPGITHWQHPRFFGYFPANNSPPSVLAELLTAGLGAQCMSWETSPAAAELEEVVMDWLRQLLGLGPDWRGVIQDTASTATLVALICARERATGGRFNLEGAAAPDAEKLVVYASSEAHSSVEKGAKIAGFGRERLRKVAVGVDYAMSPRALEQAVTADLAAGLRPAAVVATVGTTSSTAIDPLPAIGRVCREHGLWLHVDAALAGTAALLPEMRWILDGVELADSFEFNPHKWMFTNFDCAAYFVRDADFLVKTFAMSPEYLKTAHDGGVSNFRDWGVALGRRFRALKLWFVLRAYGAEGIRARVRQHLELAHRLRAWVENDPDFEVLAPAPLNLVCFRWRPRGWAAMGGERGGPGRPGDGPAAAVVDGAGEPDEGGASGDRCFVNLSRPHGGAHRPLADPALDALNERLLRALNDSGELYLTHTRLSGCYVLRLVVGQTEVTPADVEAAWATIRETARRLGAAGA